ncbi:MAG: nickel-dependent hydrogenase large subunit [Bacillota bacterium]
MSIKITVDPVTRIEGHLKIEVEVANGAVVDAFTSGNMFRGFEIILKGRDPRDTPHFTQRICGVCPVAHGTASVYCLDDAFGIKPPPNGKIARNLIQGANYIQSHILHFYHLAALDYVKGPDVAPFIPRYEADYRLTKEKNDIMVEHYLQAMDIRRKSQEMLAIFGGKMPHVMTLTAGGVTENITVEKIELFKKYLTELMDFINNTYIPDVFAVADAYSDWLEIGKGCQNLLSFGLFPIRDDYGMFLIPRGTYTQGQWEDLNAASITEDVKHSWYKDETSGLHPSQGQTEPQPLKAGGYSWIKSPRYNGLPHEVGPLARMWIAKEPEIIKLGSKAFSVMGRHAARAIELAKIGPAMLEWLDQLEPGKPAISSYTVPKQAQGVGLHEAPRGALGHWITIKDGLIENFQAVVPTTWNAGPRDDKGQRGPLEEALIGTPVADADNPVELLRVVRSFDPCLACSIH